MNSTRPRRPSAHTAPSDLAARLAEAATSVPEKPPPQRDEKGRFSKGNRGGPGNPFARQIAQLRASLIERVSEADIQHIADRLIVNARLGHLPSIRLLFLYVLGKPAAVVDPDTLDLEEWRQHIQPLPQIMAELLQALMSMPIQVATDMVQTAQPYMQRMLREELTAPLQQAEEEESDDTPTGEPHEEPTAEMKTNTQAQPSTNGGCGRAGSVPSWMNRLVGWARMAGVRWRMWCLDSG